MLGNFKKQIQEEEKEMLKISRKSPYYVGNFLKEKKFKKDIIMLRPFTGFKFIDFKKL